MIKNPPRFIWEPPKNGEVSSRLRYNNGGELRYCDWSRYLLPCSNPRKLCPECYLYHKYASPKRQAQDGVKVIRICDKCGEEITSVPLWVRVRTRSDRTVIDKELCLACAGEIVDWLEKKE